MKEIVQLSIFITKDASPKATNCEYMYPDSVSRSSIEESTNKKETPKSYKYSSTSN
jgi:hypothetical protein